MTSFAPGMRVRCRNCEWLVTRAEPSDASGSHFLVHCRGIDSLVRNHDASFLTQLDTIEPVRPEDTKLTPDSSAGFQRAKLYLEAQLRTMPATGAEPDLERMGAFDPLTFQKDAVKLALQQPRVRLLLADAVGLGKTIQAGMIVSELMRRGRAQRILVLTKKSMLAQFQSEFWNRFTIPLVRLDSDGIRSLRLRIPSNKNPFEVFYRVIISMDTLKDAARYRHFLEETQWDVVIIDEAHNVAGASSPEANKSYRLARLLSRRCENMLLTTATPHNGKPETFGRLITLLDPAIISDPDLKEYEAEEIQGYFLMRFKEDVKDELGGHLPERRLIPRKETTIGATPAEDAVYAHLADLRERTKSGEFGRKNALLAYGLYKLFLSSPEACQTTTRKRLGKDQGVSDRERELLETLESLLKHQSLSQSSRFRCLLTELKKIGWTGSADSPRIVLFTEYRETQEALFRAVTQHFRLTTCSPKQEAQPVQPVAMIHGGYPDKVLKKVIESFATGTSPIRMLIATDVASEGINLHHHCHILIHYDLPWSIITLVQRTGRIDRYGQTQPPEIRYLMVQSHEKRFRGDDVIFDRLIEKADAINKTRRTGESVLQLYDAKLEEEFIAERGILPGNELILEEKSPEYAAGSLDAILERARLALTAGGEDGILLLQNDPPPFGKGDLSRIRILDDHEFFTRGYALLASGEPEYRPLHATEILNILTAPADLRRYLGSPDQREILFGATAIPEEAYPEDHEFHLSFDRNRIELAIGAARNRSGHWSRETLLTDQHPIMLWLTERILMQFPRGEVPYVVSSELEPGEICFLFIGQVSSKSGLPLVVEPHAVSCLKGWNWQIEALRSTVARARLTTLVNDGRALKLDVAQRLLAEAVQRSTLHLEELARAKNEELRPMLTQIQRRVRKWSQRRESFLERKLTGLPTLHPHRKKIEEALSELEPAERALNERLSFNYLAQPQATTRPVLVIEGVR